MNFNDIETHSDEMGLFHFSRWGQCYLASLVNHPEQIEKLKKLGITKAADLKLPEETPYSDQEMFEKEGIDYFSFPISDIGILTKDDLVRLKDYIDGDEKVLVYCQSANRVSAALALIFSLFEGVDRGTAIAQAQKLGLTKAPLADRVRSF